jgi:GT2 family glycosyltransferase
MQISVVITSYNRPQQLAVTLKALSQQTRRPDEVIVVDNGSTVDYGKVINTAQQALPLRYHRIERSSIAHGRNISIAAATGDIIAMTDDDCIPDEGWIEALVRPFGSNDNIGQVGGSIGNNSPEPNHAEKYVHDRFNVMLNQYEKGLLGTAVDYPFAYFLGTGNSAYRRSALEEIGGFDEACITGEDVDCSVRLIKRGWQLYYEPAARVDHCYRKTLKEVLKQFTAYGRGAPYLFFKHSHLPHCLILFRYEHNRAGDQLKPYLNTHRMVVRSPVSGFINWHSIIVLVLRRVLISLALFVVMAVLFGLVEGTIITLALCALLGLRPIVHALKLIIAGDHMQLLTNFIVPLKESWSAFVAGLQYKILFIN